jgi:predicted SnoaL-like aldol condensation-catalyzing enzyme
MTKRTGIGAVGFGVVLVTMSGCATSNASLRQELIKTNTQTVLAFEETVYNKHQVQEGFAHYVGAVYRRHDVSVPDGRDAAMKALTELLLRYPNSRLMVRRTIAQGNLVAVHLVWMPQADQVRSVERVDLYRLEAGRIVEYWEVSQETPGAGGRAQP